MNKMRVAVIIGSTREGRVGDAVAKWFTGRAEHRDDLVLDVIDLIDFDLPAGLPEQATPDMKRFAARIDDAEAFVVVTPEYNRSFPASLKQAIDCAYDEWRVKPVGFVSYGYRSQGLYAVEQLRSIFTELHTATMRDTVAFNLLDGTFARDGTPFDADGQGQAVTTLLDELVWWGLLAGTVPSSVFPARHAGPRFGGMGAVSDDIGACGFTQEGFQAGAGVVAGAVCRGGDGG